jgi:hypothetical protein
MDFVFCCLYPGLLNDYSPPLQRSHISKILPKVRAYYVVEEDQVFISCVQHHELDGLTERWCLVPRAGDRSGSTIGRSTREILDITDP